MNANYGFNNQMQNNFQGIVCSRCGAVNRPDSAFCEMCGTKLVKPAPQPMPQMQPQNKVNCPSCGAANEPASRFCEQCGTKLGQGAAAPSPFAPKPAMDSMISNTPIDDEDDEKTVLIPQAPGPITIQAEEVIKDVKNEIAEDVTEMVEEKSVQIESVVPVAPVSPMAPMAPVAPVEQADDEDDEKTIAPEPVEEIVEEPEVLVYKKQVIDTVIFDAQSAYATGLPNWDLIGE